MNYLPFDISKVVKTDDWQPNIRTRRGDRVKISTTTGCAEDRPIAGIIENRFWEDWSESGKYDTGQDGEGVFDLVCILVPTYYFANVYVNDIGTTYSSLKAANAARYADYENGKLIRITFEGANPIAACLVNRHGEEIKG